METKKVLIYTNTHEKGNVELQYQSAQATLQEVVDAYNRTEIVTNQDDKAIGKPLSKLTGQELFKLISSPDELLFDKITEGQPMVLAGMELDKVQAMQLIKKPEGYTQLLSEIEDVTVRSDNGLLKSSLPKNFTLDEEGKKVLFTSFANGVMKEAGKRYAHTPNAIALHEFSSEVVALFRKKGLDKKYGSIGKVDAILTALRDGIYDVNWNDSEGYTPNHTYLGGNI